MNGLGSTGLVIVILLVILIAVFRQGWTNGEYEYDITVKGCG